MAMGMNFWSYKRFLNASLKKNSGAGTLHAALWLMYDKMYLNCDESALKEH
jgi:hypothetical protein